MHIIEVLAPVVILIALGYGLGWLQFLGRPFIGELNKLAFWVALPALVFRAAAHAGKPSLSTLLLIGVIAAATVLAGLVAWAVSRAAGIPRAASGTFVATSFFGNLAYMKGDEALAAGAIAVSTVTSFASLPSCWQSPDPGFIGRGSGGGTQGAGPGRQDRRAGWPRARGPGWRRANGPTPRQTWSSCRLA